MRGVAGTATGAESAEERGDQYGQVCDEITSWKPTLLHGTQLKETAGFWLFFALLVEGGFFQARK